ncbi:MAG: preprotein translocase subunit Sec61beta [Candidatus Bathyarchaeota archaeon]|nr:MAG: preprotein translocase subunit Sec61beta [Candidatus Bathyarchaeota archaeon]
MSSKRKKKREKKSPMPMQSAGLLRFFEEETRGVKVKPEMVIILAVVLIVFCILLKLGVLPGLPP